MKSETRRERMLRLFGDDPELLAAYEATKPPPPLTPDQQVKQSDAVLEAEGLLHLLWNPEKFHEKMCKQCNRLFATNRPQHVSLCGIDCMKKSLAEIGIDWDPTQTLESRYKRMKMLPDIAVPPEALEHLRTLLFPNGAESQPLSAEEQDTQASSF